jgi:predicted metal-dependent peptidase
MSFTQKDLTEKYKDAVRWLDDNYAYFLTNVLNIGSPNWTSAIDTACVALEEDTDAKDFTFLFSPEFAESLSVEEMAFILAHETLHVILDHLTLAKKMDDVMLANLAMDAVINDYLVSCGLTIVDGGVTGEDLIGFNCSNSSVTEVYYQLEKIRDQINQMMDDGDGPTQLDDHSWMHSPDGIDPQEVGKRLQSAGSGDNNIPEDLLDIKNDSFNHHDSYGGAGSGSGLEGFANEHGTTIKWPELLTKVSPDILHKPGYGKRPLTSFRAPRRKLTSLYPDIILPNYSEPLGEKTNKSPKKPMIVMALDTSGSISTKNKNRFISLAKSIPSSKVEIMACTFTTSYRSLDIDNPRYVSGGTCFSSIEKFIRDAVIPKNNNKYPSAVIVITDGLATFNGIRPDSVQAKNWHWLLLDQVRSYYGRYYIEPLKRYFPLGNFDDLDNYIQ